MSEVCCTILRREGHIPPQVLQFASDKHSYNICKQLGHNCRHFPYNCNFRLEQSQTADSHRKLRFAETTMLQEDVQRSQTTLEGDTKVSSELTQGSLYTMSSDRHKDERANDLHR